MTTKKRLQWSIQRTCKCDCALTIKAEDIQVYWYDLLNKVASYGFFCKNCGYLLKLDESILTKSQFKDLNRLNGLDC